MLLYLFYFSESFSDAFQWENRYPYLYASKTSEGLQTNLQNTLGLCMW